MNREIPGATHVRYLVVFATMLTAVLLYLDRFCISFAEVFIKEELGLTDGQIGFIFSAFFASYALAQVPSGWLSDRYGARLMLPVYVVVWSLFTGLMGIAGGFAALLVLRLGIGLGQAGAYPTSAGLVSRWVPFSGRGAASSLVAFGGRIGGAAAQALTAVLIVFFVPARLSSLLTPSDLLDATRWCHELNRGDADGPDPRVSTEREASAADFSARIRGLLPGESLRIVRRLAAEYAIARENERRQAKAGGRAAAEVTPRSPTREDAEFLVAGLNEILGRRDFFRESDVEVAGLQREAMRLARRPRDQLNDREVVRLNRLLLEAVYPKAIKKIYGAGWRKVMWVFGLAGFVVAAVFWLCVRDRPPEHPLCNSSEVATISHGRPASAPSPVGRVKGLPMRSLLESRSLWLSCISQFGTNVGWIFLGTWLPRYLQDVHDVPVLTRGLMAATPMVVGWCGMLSGGWLTDRLVGLVGLRWGRGIPMAASRFVAMAAFLLCLLPLSPWAATAALAVVALATDIGTPSVWAFMQDVGGRHVGSILGWGNMWGNFGAMLAPIVVGHVIQHYHNWDAAFMICAGSFLVSGLTALGVDATVPIAPGEDRDERR